jgi:hypothetical protein
MRWLVVTHDVLLMMPSIRLWRWAVMYYGVADRAQRDQVLCGVVARVTPKLPVMDLQV